MNAMTDTGTTFGEPDDTHDVVVVGGGGAGLSAAIEAASAGRTVLLLEKADRIGGSTIWSIGSISAAGTRHQVREGISDHPDEHFEDFDAFIALNSAERMPGWTFEDNKALRRRLVDNVAGTVHWLESLGIRFFGPTSEPPHRKPRMLNVLPNARAYGYFLERRARRLGVSIRTGVRASRLLVSDGRVTGVASAAGNGLERRHHARCGVVLACGDYSASQEMKRRYAEPALASMTPAGTPANTGDGQRMALEIGARIVNAHVAVPLIRFVKPPKRFLQNLPPWPVLTAVMDFALRRLPVRQLRPFIMSFLTTHMASSPKLFAAGAILVNKHGDRFCDEAKAPVYALAEQPDQSGYVVFDAAIARKFSSFPNYISTAPGIAYAYVDDYRRSRPDIFHEARTASVLATRIGADPAALVKAIADSTLGDGPDGGPYYALGPVRSYVRNTDGGLAISERFEVLGPGDTPIPGLYAAGLTGQGGTMLEGHGHHLAWAFTSGRLAGQEVARAAAGVSAPA